MKVDLHVHSHYSDGFDSVEKVLQQAKAVGVTHLSFVDHDTTKTYEFAAPIAKQYGIQLIRGIEISAYDFKRNRKVHVLGYDYHPEAKAIKALCEPLLERRNKHSLWQIEQIQTHYTSLSLNNILKRASQSKVIYKQHIMEELIDAPWSSTEYQTLYRQLFKGTGICSGDITYVDVYDAVRAIKEDGGFAVIAHPGQMDSFELIQSLVEEGLDGIERNHFDHTNEHIEQVEQLAKKYNLWMTGGSDYHGVFGKKIHVGEWLSPVEFVKHLEQL